MCCGGFVLFSDLQKFLEHSPKFPFCRLNSEEVPGGLLTSHAKHFHGD